MKYLWLSLWAAVLATSVQAQGLEGTVVKVADGDTLTVREDAGVMVRVRLTEIDAPERGQPYNQVSRRSLVELCLQQPARVESAGKDRYGRTLGRVYCSGVDVNAEQVRRGLAWAFVQYLTDPRISELQAEAQASGRGLWRDADPVAPWSYRKKNTTSLETPSFRKQPTQEEK